MAATKRARRPPHSLISVSVLHILPLPCRINVTFRFEPKTIYNIVIVHLFISSNKFYSFSLTPHAHVLKNTRKIVNRYYEYNINDFVRYIGCIALLLYKRTRRLNYNRNTHVEVSLFITASRVNRH